MSDHEYYENAAIDPVIASAEYMDVPEIRATRVYTTRQFALFHVNSVLDQNRNMYLACIHLRGNDTPIMVWRITEANVWTHLATVLPTTGHKADSLRMFIGGRDGFSLILVISTHQAISGERDNDIQIAEIPGVALAGAMRWEGEMFDARNMVNTEPQGGCDPDEIKEAVIQGLVAALGTGGSLRNLMQGIAKNGAVEAIVQQSGRGVFLSEDQFHSGLDQGIYHSNGLYQRLIETQYQVLNENRVLAAAEKILDESPKE